MERRVLEPLGYEVIDTRDLGLGVEEGFDLAVEREAVAILAARSSRSTARTSSA